MLPEGICAIPCTYDGITWETQQTSMPVTVHRFQWPQIYSLLYNSCMWMCINTKSELSSSRLQIYLIKGLLKAIENSSIKNYKSNAKNVKVKREQYI